MVADKIHKASSNAPPAAQRRPDHRSIGFSTQVRISGATTSAPTPSPDHQVSQSQPKLLQVAAPPRQRLRVPMVALIAVLRITANSRNFKTSMTRLNGMREPTKRRSRYTAMIASRVLPMPIPDVVANVTLVSREFASSAPRKTPGAARYPNQNTIAMATPVGGQTGETLALRKASERPSLAARK